MEASAMKNTEQNNDISRGHQQPNAEQIDALREWAALYGRNWKSALRTAWMDVEYKGFEKGYLLQQVRNTFGPSWLVRFVLAKDGGYAVVSSADRAKEYEAAIEAKLSGINSRKCEVL